MELESTSEFDARTLAVRRATHLCCSSATNDSAAMILLSMQGPQEDCFSISWISE